jgi:hypothetical protein
MATLIWNETRDRALKFSKAWASAAHEEQDKQTFWNEFFECFGISRKSVAVFEHAIANAKGNYGFLDLFLPGVLLVEHKSRGASFDKAESQAFSYLADLAREHKHHEMPRYVVLCDFSRFALFDLAPGNAKNLPKLDSGQRYRVIEFPLAELYKHVREFAFLKGEKPVLLDPEDPANLKATELLAELHDALEASGFPAHALERMLVRLLFCLFAEDTGIFDSPGCFTSLIERTREDGSDLGPQLAQLFQVLNQPENARQQNLDEDLASFPYVNGGLFEETLPIAVFTSAHRDALLRCCRFHWAKISPAVFGSLFQGVMEPRERRQTGAHYTSERDITKVINTLFLDGLKERLASAIAEKPALRTKRLRAFIGELRALRFLDPACGCGNFLIIAYRELRRLEMAALVAINTNPEGEVQGDLLDIRALAKVDVDQFFGIEKGEWAARIAEVGLWLTDHQCNVELAEALGRSYRRLPLKAAPTIRIGNALAINWEDVLPSSSCSFVFGNPPFVGAKHLDPEQSADMELVTAGIDKGGLLDYVCGWYVKAAAYIQGRKLPAAFVSTSSISQGEQAGVLWNYLFQRFAIKIHFAHRTFAWASEARGRAHVHVVIVGFGAYDVPTKKIFEYDGETATVAVVRNISPYLIEGPDHAIINRTTPVSSVPEVGIGNKPIDDGNYLFSAEEKETFISSEPGAAKYLRGFYGAEDFIEGKPRWCLWLGDCPPDELRKLPEVMKRVEAVKLFRESSKSAPTRKLALTPTRFHVENIPTRPYLLIPRHSSERRKYVPIGFVNPEFLAGDSCIVIPDATLFHFGVLSSGMHMAWMRQVCGRLESRYRYSANLVYNNFPWPVSPTQKQRGDVEASAKKVLDARAEFPKSTLSDLYDPVSMPAKLAVAHNELDRSVESCYRREPFESDRKRVEYLFTLLEQATTPLAAITAPSRRRRS